MNDDSDKLNEIFAEVPVRDEPSKESAQLAHAALNEEWQRAVEQQRKRRSQWQSMSIAAGFLLAAVVGVLMWPSSPLETIQVQAAGRLLIDTETVTGRELEIAPSQTLFAADEASLSMGELHMRLAAGTELVWMGESQLRLEQGEIYVDAEGDSSLLVNTRYGSVADIGTQFLVSLLDKELQASVREGTIIIEADGSQHLATPREEEVAVVVLSDSGIRQHYEARQNARWEWVHNTATRYDSERVGELLSKISHDLGKRVEFASKGVEASVATMRINGQLNPAKPRETLDIITRSSNLSYAENERTIKIDRMH